MGGGTSTGLYEVGTTIKTSLSSSYVDGTFNSYVSASKTEIIAANCVSEGQKYTMNGAEYVASSFVLKRGANTITSTYTYGKSTVIPKKSNGDDSSTCSIPAGSTSKSLTWTGYYNYYEGAVDSIPETIDREYALKLNHGAYKMTYNTSMGKKCYIICIPENKTIDVVVKSSIESNISNSIKKKEVNIKDANNSEVIYYMYYTSFDDPTGLGETNVTITFK